MDTGSKSNIEIDIDPYNFIFVMARSSASTKRGPSNLVPKYIFSEYGSAIYFGATDGYNTAVFNYSEGKLSVSSDYNHMGIVIGIKI